MAKKLGIRTKQALTVLYGGILDKPEFRFLPVSIGQVLVREGYAEQVEGKKYRGKLPYKITPAGATAILGTDYLASAYYDRELPSLDSKAAAPAQPAGDFGAGDKVVIRKDAIVEHIAFIADELAELRDNQVQGEVISIREYPNGDPIKVQFPKDYYFFTPDELTLWTPAEPGSDAKDEYTRDEEQARLIARIRELEEALEPFAALARAALSTLPDHAMPDSVWYQLNDVEITIAHFNAVIEALVDAQEERG